MSLLDNVKKPSDVKKLKIEELDILADEIRKKIISVVTENGGHLSSNLGLVDLVVALCYVYDFDEDKLVFDVGHQSYAYKILTERNEKFGTLREKDGVSGFPNIFESPYDAFCSGHAGNSVSAALGYCAARDALGEDYNVINIVGDASLFNGENLEAITSFEKKPSGLLIILNDNGMSISKNDNGLYKWFSKVTTKRSYGRMMGFFDKVFGWNFIGGALKRFKRFVKVNINNTAVIEQTGLKYLGIFDGHKIKELVRLLTNIKNRKRSVLLHVRTVKGKGYKDAENKPDYFHGVGKNLNASENVFSAKVSEILCEKAEKDERITAICAGMKNGVGLEGFERKFPERFFDVGIAEEHAVTFAAGQALGGLKPFVCIYSTFLQRAYDQIMQDVCMQNLPVIFLADRAGFVGADGMTHQGLFDIGYFGSFPNMHLFAPKDEKELSDIIDHCLSLNAPCAIRYPNGNSIFFTEHTPIGNSLWERLSDGDNVLLCVGPRMLNLAEEVKNKSGKSVGIINARALKPLDENILEEIKDKNVITLEENARIGGFGSFVLGYYADKGYAVRCKNIGAPDEFIAHATVKEQLADCGFSADDIIKYLI